MCVSNKKRRRYQIIKPVGKVRRFFVPFFLRILNIVSYLPFESIFGLTFIILILLPQSMQIIRVKMSLAELLLKV